MLHLRRCHRTTPSLPRESGSLAQVKRLLSVQTDMCAAWGQAEEQRRVPWPPSSSPTTTRRVPRASHIPY
uniref:Uncharacterized protein n=1 Tax=Oryza meridionalis TaxID=40149 RepID=A0A0E0DBN5_9ORYZ